MALITQQRNITTLLRLCLLLLISLATLKCEAAVTCGAKSEMTIPCWTSIVEHTATDTQIFDVKMHITEEILLVKSLQDNFEDHFSVEDMRVIKTMGEFDREQMVSLNAPSDPVNFTYSFYYLIGMTVNQLVLNISIIDIDDNTPMFFINNQIVIDTYHYQTPESDEPKPIISLQARDFDEGDNGTKEYMLGTGSSPLFNITLNSVNGGIPTVLLESIGVLDREEQDQHFIYVIASEGTSMPDTTMLNISVSISDVDDNPPSFTITEFNIDVSENAVANTEIVNVTAEDNDIGSNSLINYEITQLCSKTTVTMSCKSLNMPWPFALDTESGTLTLTEMLNYEDAVVYHITIGAMNPNNVNSGSSTAIVRIEVEDINNHAPEVINFFTSGGVLNENSIVSSIAATFSVQDHDSANFSKYELKLLDKSTMNISTTFGLGSTGSLGTVLLAAEVDREQQDKYELEIVATDLLNSSLFSTYSFTIQIGDDNDHPPVFVPIQSPYPLLEGSPIGTLVLQLNVTDEDIGINAQIRYTLPPNTDEFPYQQMFSLGATDGKLHVQEIPDRETTPTLYIKVQANDEDGEGFLAEMIVNISITDINDNSPYFTTTILPSLKVKENVTTGTVILDVDASDNDIGTNADLTFSLSSPSESNLPISINSISGIITINDTLDHETIQQYTVHITVSDSVTTPAVKTFDLIVLDVNDNKPYFQQGTYFKSLYENATIGTHVVTVVASDADSAEFTQFSYSFANGFDHSHFSLNLQTGEVTTSVLLDWEYKPSYMFEVIASDGNGLVSLVNALITVTITDVNDEIPQFTNEPYIFYVKENINTQVPVGNVSAISKEIGNHGSAVFSIINTETVPFIINSITGVVTTNGNLDREEKDFYQLIIKVDDVAPPVNDNTTIATIIVQDINDNPPKFQHALVNIELSELYAVNSGFYTAIATDSDLYPNNVTIYSLEGSQPQFQIDSSTGVLSLTSSLNYENQLFVMVDITATDETGPNAYIDEMQLNITVLDDNNTNITFPSDFPLKLYTEESAANGQVLLNFTAQDSKANPQLHLNYFISYIGGGASGDFGIDVESVSGYALLTTANELDREIQSSYSLNITITDHNSPPNSVTQFLTVYITDINDNPPMFTGSPFVFMFNEEQSGIIEIGQISADDPDFGENGTVTFSLLESSELFSINENTGALSQIQSLDRETASTHSITVIASDGGNPTKMAVTIVTVNVLDVNDHCPEFSPMYIAVEENIQLGTIVETIIGNDADIGSNGQVSFYRDKEKESTATDHFMLLENGTVIVLKVPDYEEHTNFIYFIKVSDNGNPKCENIGNLTIEIKDQNDNPPVFTGTDEQYIIEVSEAEWAGYAITTIVAEDKDTGMAGDIQYVIESIADQVLFEIEIDGGVLKLKSSLDYEKATQHVITVLAYDNGRPRNWVSRQNVTINVGNVDDNNPTFDINPYNFVIQENQPVQTLVGTLRAYDEDTDSKTDLTYKLSQLLPVDGNSFTVSQTQEYADIKTVTSLDYELEPYYLLELTVVSKLKEAKTLIQIYVQNLNDEKPSFSKSEYTASISELISVGSSILFVNAIDPDNNTNDAVTYSITNGNEDNKFYIDSSTGEVRLNEEIDYEIKTTYTLVVMSTDTGAPPQTDSSTIIITVINENEHTPLFDLEKYSFSITEEMDGVTTIGPVTASDSDGGSYGNIEYSFKTPNDQFTIDSSSGIITSKFSIDREATPTFNDLVVIATDTMKSSTVNVSITVIDINDNPPLFQNSLYQFSIPFDQSPGVSFAMVTSTDLDLPENSNVKYTVTEATPFDVNLTTGDLFLTSTLPLDYKPSYLFTMVAMDTSNSTPSSQTTVEVFTYTDTNHPPFFEQLVYTVNVTEDTVSNTEIITVKATDSDGDTLTYSLENNYQKFSIDTNGVITLTNLLDYEDTPLYGITVFAADTTPSESRTASSTVIVSVVNINDVSPQFDNPPSMITLSPVPFLEVQLFQLQASDPDSSSISFSLFSQTNIFAIDPVTGVISNLVVLEDGSDYSLNFRVSDGTHTQDTNVQVSIVDSSSSNIPTFTEDNVQFSVSESEQAGFIIHTFTAINPSEYNIVCCDSFSEVFIMDTSSGVLSLRTGLDYEAKTEYNLIVEARNENSNVILSDYQEVHIIVTNVNEYTPTFIGNADKTVNEGLSDESLITHVLVEDDDSGVFGDVTLTIIQGNDGNTFEILPSGVIKLAAGKTLDREEVKEYELLIKAADGGGRLSSLTVIITVLDLNDSPPTYSSNFTVGVYENSAAGVRVAQVTAYDPDSTSQLGYSLGIVESYLDLTYVGVASNMFKINSTTAVITLNGELNREIVDKYMVQVSSTDSNTNTMTFLNIHVLDVNDNPPVFSQVYSTSIHEFSRIGSVVLTVTATDKDNNMNGIVQYSLADNWPLDEFIIDRMSGTIRVNNLIPFFDICNQFDKFVGTVIATDGLYTTSTNVTIQIDDINNHAPIFIDNPYILVVSETATVNYVITALTIEDSDCFINANFDTSFPTYYHYPSDLFTFTKNYDTNKYEIKVKAPLVQGVYHFRIQAYNSISFPMGYDKAGFGTFIVTILPENVHSPKFSPIDYRFEIFEDSYLSFVIGSVEAIDDDYGESGDVTYSLPQNSSSPFNVIDDTGYIIVTGSLDYEVITEYTFIVIATDSGYPAKSSSVSVTVSIKDVNDNSPIISDSLIGIRVTENTENGTYLFTVAVNDSDTIPSNNLMFRIDATGVPFVIDHMTGEFYTMGNIDYEENQSYEFSVSVRDLDLSPLVVSTSTIIVNVTGVNEFSPVFSSSQRFVLIDHQRGDFIGNVVAIDNDKGPDGNLTYSFSILPELDYFKMLTNGSIYLREDFTPSSYTVSSTRNERRRETNGVQVTAEVEVKDGGIPPSMAKTNITIEIPSVYLSGITEPTSGLPLAVVGGIGGSVALLIIILLVVLIIGSILYKNRSKNRKTKFQLQAENAHRSSTRLSTAGTIVSEVELQHYISRDGTENVYVETEINGEHRPNDDNSESPDASGYRRPSPHTRSTSDLASSVATDTLNLTQDGFQYSKAQIEHIYATNMNLLNDHSQDSVHMFGSEGGGEAEGDEMDDMMFAKYDLEIEGHDGISFCGGKSHHSLISESSEGGREEYQFSQSTNPWSSRHSIIVDRSMNELGSDAGSRPVMYHFETSQQGPGIYGASTQGSTISLTRSLHNRNKYGSERDIRNQQHYPPPQGHTHHHHPPHPSHIQRYEYYPEVPHPHRYGSPIMEYRTENKPRDPPPPPYLSQDPYLPGPHYYHHMDSRISPDHSRTLPQYENLLSTSSTSLSTNASHSRGRPFPLAREHYH